MLVGAALRALPVLNSSFPPLDGGMFYVMVQDLLRHHFDLPVNTSYNGGTIPFAYPPLALYLAAAIHAGLGMNLLDIFRFLPLLASIATIGAFASLANVILSSRVAVLASVFAFSLAPDAYYEVSGGGLTRSLGMLFSLLTLGYVVRMYRTGKWSYVVLAAVFGGLTLLSHLEWTWFVAYSTPVLLFAYARTRAGIARTVIFAAGSCAIASPWWVDVIARHGLGTILATVTGSAHVWPWYGGLGELLMLNLSDEMWLPIFTVLALLGILISMRDRHWLLPLWLLTVCLVESRGTLTRAVVPGALLAGVGVELGLLPILLGTSQLGGSRARNASSPRFAAAVLGALLGWALIAGAMYEMTSPSHAVLPPSERRAMAWVARNTPASSRFVTVTGMTWGADKASEWFPTLTRREDVDTVQGLEWIPGAFARGYMQDRALQACASRGSGCLRRWLRETGLRVRYVYIEKRSVGAVYETGVLQEAMQHDPSYRRIFDDAGAIVFVRRSSSNRYRG